jgi:crotonobetainyl-CoA:carnitine CoA-transferase CaiB-like acyl-CoA transferase
MTALERSVLCIERPLEGIRVLDVSRFLAGPYAAWVLAELGADVVKLEDPDRPDEARSVGPYFHGEQSLYFAALNTGKRSLAVRFRKPEGRDLVRKLLREVDVVLDNNRPGVMDDLGLGAADLAQENPSVITCSLSGFGSNGPLSDRPGYDYTIQALSGVMSMTGEPENPPGKAGISYVDHSGGLAAALAVCAALVGRGRTGKGGHVELALFDVQMSMLSYLAAWNLNEGFEGDRTASASHPSLVPAQNFATADGFISVFVGNDAMWARLAQALDDAFLAQGRFLANHERQQHRVDLVERLSDLLSRRESRYWVELLGRYSVPCAPINTLTEALNEEHTRERGLVAAASHPAYGRYQYVRGPLPIMGDVQTLAAPLLGQDTDYVLRDLGVSELHIRSLIKAGIVQTTDARARTSTAPQSPGQSHNRGSRGSIR